MSDETGRSDAGPADATCLPADSADVKMEEASGTSPGGNNKAPPPRVPPLGEPLVPVGSGNSEEEWGEEGRERHNRKERKRHRSDHAESENPILIM